MNILCYLAAYALSATVQPLPPRALRLDERSWREVPW